MRLDGLIQNSPEWYKFRESRIGASDAPIICGLSPYKTAHQLWLEKTGQVIADRSGSEFAMARGHYLEPIIRGRAGFELDITFYPACFISDDYDMIMASLDGISECNSGLEAKYAAKKDHDLLIENDQKSIPKKYYPQCQHQFIASKVGVIYYASYSINFKTEKDHQKGDLKIVKIFRDDDFLSRYIPAAEAFSICVTKKIPPQELIIHV